MLHMDKFCATKTIDYLCNNKQLLYGQNIHGCVCGALYFHFQKDYYLSMYMLQ